MPPPEVRASTVPPMSAKSIPPPEVLTSTL
jgi:hypothetical protein